MEREVFQVDAIWNRHYLSRYAWKVLDYCFTLGVGNANYGVRCLELSGAQWAIQPMGKGGNWGVARTVVMGCKYKR
jgi:hypothetical protein